MTDPIVRVRHVREAKLCLRGARAWFAHHDGLEWSVFVDRGYPASVLEATGDAIALQVCAVARKEVTSNG